LLQRREALFQLHDTIFAWRGGAGCLGLVCTIALMQTP
jgi:hypothetical protein